MPPAARNLPRVCDHVVEPGEWRELHDGVLVEVQPAKPPHARAQAILSSLLGPSVTPGYGVDVDLLTRTSSRWDFASDVCVRRNGMDPQSECRYLEELVFEVNYSQRESTLESKAQQMIGRGVRRVFVIDVSDAEGGTMPRIDGVREWTDGRWQPIGMDGMIEDPCLQRPLTVRGLQDALEADNAVARALAARNNPVIAGLVADGEKRGRDSGRAEGLTQARRADIRAVLARRGMALSHAHEARLDACQDPDGLQAWLLRALTARHTDEVFDP